MRSEDPKEHSLSFKHRSNIAQMTDANEKNKLDELSDNVISVPKKRWKILSDVGIKNNMMHSMDDMGSYAA